MIQDLALNTLTSPDSLVIDINVTSAATQAEVFISGNNGSTFADPFTVEIAGLQGTMQFAFASGISMSDAANAIEQMRDVTGVGATVAGTGRIALRSINIGSDAFVSVRPVDGFETVDNDINIVYETDSQTTTTIFEDDFAGGYAANWVALGRVQDSTLTGSTSGSPNATVRGTGNAAGAIAGSVTPATVETAFSLAAGSIGTDGGTSAMGLNVSVNAGDQLTAQIRPLSIDAGEAAYFVVNDGTVSDLGTDSGSFHEFSHTFSTGGTFRVGFVAHSSAGSPSAQARLAVDDVQITRDTGAQEVATKTRTTRFGTDAKVTVNGLVADVDGTVATISTRDLDLSVNIHNTEGQTTFLVTGGGAKFNLGQNAEAGAKVHIGLHSMTTGRLGTGDNGRLAMLGAGGSANILDGDIERAQRIVQDAIKQVADERGRLGTLVSTMIRPRLAALRIANENTTAAISAIRDTDFAQETARLSRGQLLQQTTQQSLSVAGNSRQSVLDLVKGIGLDANIS